MSYRNDSSIPKPAQATASGDAPGPRLTATKVQSWHRERLAIVYVRQSSPQQVLDNKESGERQYALRQRAIQLGWAADRVLVIDTDQGRSGSTAEGRLGFQRLMAEVGLDHVGLILGLELNRLARSCKDWHQLLELCAIFRTLLADQDGLYDPTDYNDRLLLGLTGIMSEAELHVLRRRMHEGKLNKARRGALFTVPPIGYVKLPTSEFALDPDEQVQDVVRLIFDQFERVGTIRKVRRYLLEHEIRVGVRPHAGPNRGQLEWHLPGRDTVAGILENPIYAGYYRYGRRQVDPRRKTLGKPGSGRVVVPSDAYIALLPDRCPAYITKERYDSIQQRLAANRARAESKGVPREGPSLLGGLIFCAQCGHRMVVHYGNTRRQLRYACITDQANGMRAGCQSMVGDVLDRVVAEHVLAALQPGALELSLAAADDVRREREQLDQNWRQRLERVRIQVERAERQYQAVEPENRLVARTLERRWEEAMEEQRHLEEEYARFRRTQPVALTTKDHEQIRALAQDLPALWYASTTTTAERQRIIRFLVERVAVAIEGMSNRVTIDVQWVGGGTSQHDLLRPVQRYEQMADFDRLIERIRQLHGSGMSFGQIADCLNQEGYRPLKGADHFHRDMVGRILRRRSSEAKPRQRVQRGLLQKHEWFVVDLAEKLRIPKNTLHAWIRRGWIRARSQPGYRAPCICWADADERARLRKLHRTPRGWWDPPLPGELTTPKPCPAN